MRTRFGNAFIVYVLGSAAVGGSAYFMLPEQVLPQVTAFIKNLWTVLGPLGAFAVQIVLQLIALGDWKLLNETQARKLSTIVDQRLRFVWYVVAATLLALLLSATAASLDDAHIKGRLGRAFIASALAFTCLASLFSMRLPAILREIKECRWRLASEQRAADERATGIAALRRERSEPHTEICEPERRNGTI
jgi:hypothetical protein